MLVKGVENKQWAVETALACIHDKTKAVYDLLSEEDFYKLLERVEAKYIGYENDKIFTIVQDNIPIGWCYFFVDEKNRYEKLSGLYTIDNSQYDPQEIIQYIDVNYGEYTKDVVFTREKQHMITCFEKNGYQVIEDSWHMQGCINSGKEHPDISKLDLLDYNEYAIYHDSVYGELFWNAERIRGRFDQFLIFIRRENGEIRDSLFISCLDPHVGQIYGVNASSQNNFINMLESAGAHLGKDHPVALWCDNEQEVECGKRVGLYVHSSCYSMQKCKMEQ